MVGLGHFRAAGIFFRYQIPCTNIFFFLRPPPPPPPPDKFSNGPSLTSFRHQRAVYLTRLYCEICMPHFRLTRVSQKMTFS